MARFCGNCGTQLGDDTKICGNCGTPLDGVSGRTSHIKLVDPEKEKVRQIKTKKIIKWCLGIIILSLVAVIASKVIATFTGYNGLLRKTMTAYEEYDIDALISLSSDMYFYGGEDYAEVYFENAVGNTLDSFESAVGHSFKFSYEVDEIYAISNRNLESMLDSISWMYSDFDISTIKEIVVADITITAKQGSKSVNRDLKLTMSKEAGDWKILYIE